MNKLAHLALASFLALSGLTLPAQHADPSEPLNAMTAFKPAEGLKVELFAAEPLLMNPVAFSIDERGRFYVSETHRYREAIFDITKNMQWLLEDLAFRKVEDRTAFLAEKFATNFHILTNDTEIVRFLEDRDGDGKADHSSVFAEGFRESTSGTAAGVLARDGNVWFTCIPELWKLTDSNGDGVSDQREKLHSGFGVRVGVTGHDLHGVIMGPDGRLYFSIGDRAYAPPADIKGYGFTTAFLRHVLPDTGAVFRCHPDGSGLEVFAIGLRNPQELAFDHEGNLWTVDNDTAGKDDARVIHVVQGGDYGWRVSYQHQKGFGPWVLENLWQGRLDDVLPPAGVVAQGPSGLTYNPGPYLGEKYHRNFFICDFPRGIWNFSTERSGASYVVAQKEQFIWGVWATDVEFGNDGALFVADWTAGWNPNDKGRLYRVTHRTAGSSALSSDAARLLAAGFESHGARSLLELLDHPDYRIRREAQFTAARKAAAGFQDPGSAALINGLWQIAQGRHPNSSRHAFWALEQVSRALKSSAEREKLLQPLPKLAHHTAPETRRLAAWLAGEAHAAGMASTLRPLLADADPGVAYAAAVSLGKLGDADGLARTAELATRNADADPFLTHAIVSALTHAADANVLEGFARSTNASVRRAALLVFRRLENPAVETFLKDPSPRLVIEAARAINDVPIPAAFPALAGQLAANSFTHVNATTGDGLTNGLHQLLIRAVNAHFRQGQEANALALARFAAGTNQTLDLRVEALAALADWAKPSPLDRVMGLWRPLPERDAAPAQNALAQVLPVLWAEGAGPLLAAAAEAAGKSGLRESSPALLHLFQDDKAALPSRIAALLALDQLRAPELAPAVKAALQGQNISLRREGVRLIDRAGLPDAAALLERIIENEKEVRLVQSAFDALGRDISAHANAVIERQLAKLIRGDLRKEVQLDLLEAAEKRGGSSIQALLAQYRASRRKDDVIAQYREALYGGDSAAGRKLVTSRMDFECLRCHQVGAAGGIVGPSLNGVGKRLTKEQLLEAIMLPNRQIAPGYENATFILKNGRNASGLVKSETDAEVVVESGEDGLITIKKADVERRVASLSAMPEGFNERLTRQELRDMVEYLSNLKK